MTQPIQDNTSNFSRPDTWWSMLSEEEKSSIMCSHIKNKAGDEYSKATISEIGSKVERYKESPDIHILHEDTYHSQVM